MNPWGENCERRQGGHVSTYLPHSFTWLLALALTPYGCPIKWMEIGSTW